MDYDAYVSTTRAMRDTLAAIGWDATVEYLAGGLWGIVVNPGDGPRLLVSMDPDDHGTAPWVVGLDCQEHPSYGFDDAIRFVPWGDDLPGRLSIALHVLRTLPMCECEDCSE